MMCFFSCQSLISLGLDFCLPYRPSRKMPEIMVKSSTLTQALMMTITVSTIMLDESIKYEAINDENIDTETINDTADGAFDDNCDDIRINDDHDDNYG